MFGRNLISDKDLLKSVNQRMARTGTASQSRINVSVQQGTVTLSGNLQHAIQRSPIVKAVSRVAGVRRVIDQMQLIVRKIIRPDAARIVPVPVLTSPPETGSAPRAWKNPPPYRRSQSERRSGLGGTNSANRGRPAPNSGVANRPETALILLSIPLK